MIYLGPGGVPISSKERSNLAGIKTCASLGLNAMEVEFVRGVNMSTKLAEEIGETAKQFKVRLSIHAPYYINLCSEHKKIVEASKDRIFDSADRGEKMGADAIAIHVGYYGKLSKEQAYKIIKKNFLEIFDRMKEHGIKNVKLGAETMGKLSQFGNLDEAIRLCKDIGVVPYIDFSHIYALHAGKIDYKEILDKIEKLKLKHINSHFQSVKWNPAKISGFGHERHHMELKFNQPPFEPLAKEIIKRKLDITLISESPILEKDSLKMKEILEKLGYKF